jgi:hypothetical protein
MQLRVEVVGCMGGTKVQVIVTAGSAPCAPRVRHSLGDSTHRRARAHVRRLETIYTAAVAIFS